MTKLTGNNPKSSETRTSASRLSEVLPVLRKGQLVSGGAERQTLAEQFH